MQPFEPAALAGIRPHSLRMFRWDPGAGEYEAIWRSGVNVGLSEAWARITRPGLYVLIGLPLDPLLFEAIRAMAVERRTLDDVPEEPLRGLFDLPDEALEELRALLTRVEVQNSVEGMSFGDIEVGTGGHPIGVRLPRGSGLEAFRGRIKEIKIPPRRPPRGAAVPPPVGGAPRRAAVEQPGGQGLARCRPGAAAPGPEAVEVPRPR